MSPEERLVKRSSRDYIWKRIEEAQLDPKDFRWSAVSSGHREGWLNVSCLTHLPTGSYMTFDYTLEDDFSVGASPGAMGRHVSWYEFQEWGDVLLKIRSWLERVKIEDDSPDYWKVLEQQTEFQEAAARSSEEAQLTPSERIEILQKVDQVAAILTAMQHTADDRHQSVMDQIEYVRRASERLGRKDLLNIAAGVVGNIGTALAIPK
jgi:hypothetical protein